MIEVTLPQLSGGAADMMPKNGLSASSSPHGITPTIFL